jgi:hypothetical protein
MRLPEVVMPFVTASQQDYEIGIQYKYNSIIPHHKLIHDVLLLLPLLSFILGRNKICLLAYVEILRVGNF